MSPSNRNRYYSCRGYKYILEVLVNRSWGDFDVWMYSSSRKEEGVCLYFEEYNVILQSHTRSTAFHCTSTYINDVLRMIQYLQQ